MKLIIAVILFSTLINSKGFSQYLPGKISNEPNKKSMDSPAGVYILSIKNSTKKYDPNLPTGKIKIWKIKDSTYKIFLKYTGVPPAKNLGIIDDTIIIINNAATYTTKEDPTCKIKFFFSNTSVKIDQHSESNAFACGFGRNIFIDGEYIKEKKEEGISNPLKAGKIGMTLQWIGWEKRGVAYIKDSDNGFFQIQGRQSSENGKDFLEITGILHQSSSTEIIFEGMIKTSVSYINQGNVCERKGKYTFIAKPGKKYWRLKESKNCEGGMTTDYIDLYF